MYLEHGNEHVLHVPTDRLVRTVEDGDLGRRFDRGESQLVGGTVYQQSLERI